MDEFSAPFIGSMYGRDDRWKFEEECYYDYSLRIWNFPKPTIAQVQGGCIAGAFMVANMCDLMVASDDAFFSYPVSSTLGAAAVEVLIHPWVMGLRRAKEFLYTGERISAEEGYRWPAAGFVDTEIRCLTELESWNAKKEVQPRVQA